jgi:uncharacterized protein YfaS (alpha-2-macroglobulin family)
MDIRDDRVNFFFGLTSGQIKNFAIKIHPTFAGVFWWSGVVLEAMYSPDYFAGIAGQQVIIG